MRMFRCRYLLLAALLPLCAEARDRDMNLRLWRHEIDSMKTLLAEQGSTRERQFELTHLIANLYALYSPDSTILWARRAIPLARELKLYDDEATLCHHTAVSWTFKGRYDSTFVYLDRASDISAELKDEQMAAGTTNLRAHAYWQQGMHLTAIDNYLKVLAVAEKYNNADGAVSMLCNLANINREMNNTEAALQYLRQAEEWSEELKKVPHTGYARYEWAAPEIWNAYAAIYLQRGDLPRAGEFARRADSINVNGIINKNQSKRLLAEIHLLSGDYDSALQEAGESLEMAELLGDKALHINSWQIISDIYLAQGRYGEAESEAFKAWQADSTNVNAARATARNIAMANVRMGNAAKAARYLEIYDDLNRQYSEKSFQTAMSDMATGYETEKKELRIGDLERARILYIAIGIVCLLLAVSVWLFLRRKIRDERREKQLVAANAVLEWEKKERKRFASDLHDGINGMLSAIKFELGAVENLQNVRNRLDECIDAIRAMSRSRMPTSLQRYGLKASLEDYCRLFPNVDFHFYGSTGRMDEKLELTVYYCAYELVNNAFKHSGAKKINVQLVQNDGSASLTVQDDGCGFDEQTVKAGGLGSIRDRVASLAGKIDIATSPEKGTEVNIEFRET